MFLAKTKSASHQDFLASDCHFTCTKIKERSTGKVQISSSRVRQAVTKPQQL